MIAKTAGAAIVDPANLRATFATRSRDTMMMDRPMTTEPLVVAPEKQKSASSKSLDEAKRKLLWGIVLCFAFMLAEVVGGLLAHSLAVMTDAAHMLSDVAGFIVSVLALLLSGREATAQYSFGYHRAEVLGALASIMVVWVMTGILLYEAVKRLINPEVVDGCVMFWVSFLGILMNLVLMQVLSHGEAEGFGHGHSHGHSHSHGHCHGHGPPPKKKKKYTPPAVKQSSHDHSHSDHGHHEAEHQHGPECDHDHHDSGHHDVEHGHHDSGHQHGPDCCDHDHGPPEHGHHDHGHSEKMPSRMKKAMQEQKEKSHHGHDHDEKKESHHGHDHDENGDCCGGGDHHGHGHGHGHHDSSDEEDEEGQKEAENLAVRAAMAHVIGDILQSVGVCVSAALIWGLNDRWLGTLACSRTLSPPSLFPSSHMPSLFACAQTRMASRIGTAPIRSAPSSSLSSSCGPPWVPSVRRCMS